MGEGGLDLSPPPHQLLGTESLVWLICFPRVCSPQELEALNLTFPCPPLPSSEPLLGRTRELSASFTQKRRRR